jgi:hypothetical protein
MTAYDLAYYQRLREEYETRWGEPNFDEHKLLDMISGCARRRILRDRTDLTPKQEQELRAMIDNERADLWK